MILQVGHTFICLGQPGGSTFRFRALKSHVGIVSVWPTCNSFLAAHKFHTLPGERHGFLPQNIIQPSFNKKLLAAASRCSWATLSLISSCIFVGVNQLLRSWRKVSTCLGQYFLHFATPGSPPEGGCSFPHSISFAMRSKSSIRRVLAPTKGFFFSPNFHSGGFAAWRNEEAATLVAPEGGFFFQIFPLGMGIFYNWYINPYYWVDEFIPYYKEIMGV